MDDLQLLALANSIDKDRIGEFKKQLIGFHEMYDDNRTILFALHIVCIRMGDSDGALFYWHKIFTKIEFHALAIRSYTNHFRDQNEFLYYILQLNEKYPNEPYGYFLKVLYYHQLGGWNMIRKTIKECYDNSRIGIHYQPMSNDSIFNAGKVSVLAKLESPDLPDKTLSSMRARCLITANRSPEELEQHINRLPLTVLTAEGEAMGLKNVFLNGKISHATIPTQYFFKYGYSPAELTHRTAVRSLPPGLTGHAKDEGSNVFGRITTSSLTSIFVDSGDTKTIGPSSFKLEGPFGKDRNHLEGVGAIDLILGWKSTAHSRGEIPKRFNTDIFPVPRYPGEMIDLRDAQFSVTYRSLNLDTKEFYPVAFVQGYTGTAYSPDRKEDYTTWAHTADLGNWNYLDDGEWHQASFQFESNSKDWSFCAGNVEETGEISKHITYHPIGDVLRENKLNVCLCLIGGDEMVPPEGDLEIGALELSYRSYSLLSPHQGTALIECPRDSISDPNLLTGGWLGDFDHYWLSCPEPAKPMEFIWEFRDQASISTVKIHQHPLWPAKDIELSISDDGIHFIRMCDDTLNDIPSDQAEWIERGDDGELFAKVFVFDVPKIGRYIKLTIKSGYRTNYWGLDAIEVFGDAPALIPSPEPFTLTEKITDLEPGTVYCQLITENSEGRIEGEVIEITRPITEAPIISDHVLISRTDDSARIKFRTNAMGSWGTLSGETENNPPIKSNTISIGKTKVFRDSILHFKGLKSGVPINGTAMATNEHGSSLPYHFKIPLIPVD